MYIEKVSLTNYRNYETLDLTFGPGVNLILGDNAQGKTNLLESLYMSAMGRSFRTNRDQEMIQFGKKFARVEIGAIRNQEKIQIEIKILPGSKKTIRKNKVTLRRTSELLDSVLIVIFSPEDLKIVKEEPEKRRKFLDRELCQISPAYYDSWNNYRKILQQRNAALKEISPDPFLLDLWDVQMARYGARIIQDRAKFVAKLSRYSGDIHNNITGCKEKLEIRYEPNVEWAENQQDQEALLYEKIRAHLPVDLKMRTSGRGPHRDDIGFFIHGMDARAFGSQGQQRTCALSLKLAELDLIREETGEEAILLLDDVMSELDESRQTFLIETLQENQLFITTTDVGESVLSRFPNANIYHVRNGKV